MPKANKPLTPKQKRFIEEYLIDSNGTQAAIRAGFSEKTANQQAAQMLREPRIRKYLDEQRAKHAERHGVTIEYIVNGFKAVAEDPNSTGAEKNSALDKLAKREGFYEKHNKQRQNSFTILNIDPLSND